MSEPRHVPASEPAESGVPGIRLRVLLPAAATGGGFSLFEEITAPRSGPPLHVHAAAEEFFRVLEGRYLFRVGEATVEASAGDTLMVPRGVTHCFFNPTDALGRLFMGFAPGGGEAFFDALAASGLRPPADMAAIGLLAAEHDLAFLGPNPFADH